MKVSTTILSLPPYISTAWKNVASLHLENQSHQDVLIVTLHSGARIEVPSLNASLIETIFAAHVNHLEQEELRSQHLNIAAKPAAQNPAPGHFIFELMAMQGPTASSEKNSALDSEGLQANSPPLPEEILFKITDIAQALGFSQEGCSPSAEEDCNCLKCQIANALRSTLRVKDLPETSEAISEEEVSDEDLAFASWIVSKAGDNLYTVTNPTENLESYQVHLGNPMGCTCGEPHCEHIRAVLKT